MADTPQATTQQGDGAPAPVQGPRENTPESPQSSSPDETGGGSSQDTKQEPEIQVKPEVRARFEKYQEDIRALQGQLAEAQSAAPQAPATPPVPNPGIPGQGGYEPYPELIGMPTDAIGNVLVNNKWMPPEVASDVVRMQMNQADLSRRVAALETTRQQAAVEARTHEALSFIQEEVTRLRDVALPNLDDAAKAKVDRYIALELRERGFADGEFNPMKAFDAIPDVMTETREVFGHLGNLTIQQNLAAARNSPNPTGGGVAMPGQVPLDKMPQKQRRAFLKEIGERALQGD